MTGIANRRIGGSFRTPMTMNSRAKMSAPTTAPTALTPSQSATRRLPGLPASASRFSVRSWNDELAIRDIEPETRFASGRSVRSMNGCWSSSSSRFLACIAPSWVRRAWTGSTDERLVSPRKIRRIAPAATAAMRIGTKVGIGSDLDVDDATDEHEADEHHESAEQEEHDPGRQPEDGWRVEEHRLHEVGRGDEQEPGEADGQEPDDVARQALLGRQRPDLALDPDPLANRVRDRVEDLGEVAADGVLDRDRGGHQLEVVRANAADHVLERLLERQAEVDLADDAAELGRDRRPRLAHDELDRLEERGAGTERVREERDRVRQLLVERVQAAGLAAAQPESRQQEADQRADDEEQRIAEGRQAEGEHDHGERDSDDGDRPDREELAGLELEVGAGD